MIVNIGPMQFGKEKPANEMKFSDTVVNIIYHEDSPTPVEVNIPAGTKKIRSHILYDAWPEGGYNITIPEGCTEIQSEAFTNTSIKTIKLPSTIETIADNAFSDTDIGMVIYNKTTDARNIGTKLALSWRGCTTDNLVVRFLNGDVIFNAS